VVEGDIRAEASRYRVLIVDDFALVRDGLRALLAHYPVYEIVGEASNGLEAVTTAQRLAPDLVLLDQRLPQLDGIEAIGHIKRVGAHIKVIFVAELYEEVHLRAALQAGADGFVLKQSGFDELDLAMKSVLRGRRFVSPAVSGEMIEAFAALPNAKKEGSTASGLSKREREVLKLIAEGHRNRQVADLLFISLKTVEKHRASLMHKLGLHSVAALTAYAIKNGLLA